jgi:hypothetical protein
MVGNAEADEWQDCGSRLATLDPEVCGVAAAGQHEHLSGHGDEDQTYGGSPHVPG